MCRALPFLLLGTVMILCCKSTRSQLRPYCSLGLMPLLRAISNSGRCSRLPLSDHRPQARFLVWALPQITQGCLQRREQDQETYPRVALLAHPTQPGRIESDFAVPLMLRRLPVMCRRGGKGCRPLSAPLRDEQALRLPCTTAILPTSNRSSPGEKQEPLLATGRGHSDCARSCAGHSRKKPLLDKPSSTRHRCPFRCVAFLDQ